MAVLAMAIVKKGDAEIPGLTDNTIPRRLGPKRASKIRSVGSSFSIGLCSTANSKEKFFPFPSMGRVARHHAK